MTQPHKDPKTKPLIRVAWVAHQVAPASTGELAEKYLKQWLPSDSFEFTEDHPEIVLFMSGGSERKAIEIIHPDQPVLLLTIRENNSYAAATEVMAWLKANHRFAMLSDAREASETGLIDRWRKAVAACHHLHGMKAGLIGFVSDWLVASDTSAARLAEVFGITLETIPWNTFPDYINQEPDPDLLLKFRGDNTEKLRDASRVLSLLRSVIKGHRLDAVTVECFNLARQRKVTACLALAQLQAEGMVAACEGDVTSMVGMMLAASVTGQVPWMANTTGIYNNVLFLSHCTVPLNLVTDIRLMSHYETDCSLAVKGRITSSDVTIFRLSGLLDKAFITEGTVSDLPDRKDACRTQVEIKLPLHSLALMRENPLGNHIIMMPGKHADTLRMACQVKAIEIIS